MYKQKPKLPVKRDIDSLNYKENFSHFINNSFRHLSLAIYILISTVGFVAVSLMNFPSVNADNAFTASDLLGQTDNSNNPVFTTSYLNNIRAPNANGFRIGDNAGTTVDGSGHRLFVVDAGNNRVLIFNLNSSNELIDRTADNVLGQANFNTNATATTATGMWLPQGLAYDSAHQRLFVADAGNNRVLVFNTTSITNGMAAANVIGQTAFTTRTTSRTQSTLNGANHLAFDATGNRLFVADWLNRRVLVFNTASISDGMLAANVIGQANFTAGVNTCSQNGVSIISGIAYDDTPTKLFVSDENNSRILIFNLSGGASDGMLASNVLGQINFNTNSSGKTQSKMTFPRSLAVDPGGNRLFAADGGANNGYNRILVFNLSGGISDGMLATSVLGQINFTANHPYETTQSSFISAFGLSYDPTSQHLFVSDGGPNGPPNNRVMIFDVTAITDGENAVDMIGQTDGNDTPVYTAKNANNTYASSQGLNNPTDSALDTTHHRLFVGDQVNNRVLVYNLDGSNNLLDRSADNVLGQANFVNNAGKTTQSGMLRPSSLAYDDAHQRLFVADSFNSRVLVFDLTAGITNGMNATNVLGQTLFDTANCNTDQSGLCSNAGGIALETGGNRLFIADNGNNRVLVFDLSGGITDGMDAANVLGQTLFDTSDCNITQKDLCLPQGIAFDSVNKRLFVGETNNQRVMIFNLSDGITDGMDAANVLGQTLFDTADFSMDSIGICGPVGITYDVANQRLFVTDSCVSRIMVFDVTPSTMTDGKPASAVLGQVDFASSACITTQTALCGPGGAAAYDPTNGRLYQADTTNNRVIIWDLIHITTNTLGSGTVGTTYSQTISAINGQGTKNFSISSGSLPTGLALDTTTGVVSGTPTTPGSYNFTVTASDDNGAIGIIQDSHAYSVTVSPVASVPSNLSITSSSLSNGTDGATYGQTISVTGGQAPYSYSVNTDNLPPGITLNTTTGAISGTPTKSGDYSFTIHVIDGLGASTARTFTVTISAITRNTDTVVNTPTTDDSNPGDSTSSTPATVVSPAVNLLAIIDANLPNTEGSPPTDAVAVKPIIIYSFPDYFEAGHSLDLKVGDEIKFCATATVTCQTPSKHTITIKNSDPKLGIATLTFASTPFDVVFKLGVSQDIDVTKDGKPDIRVTLTGITDSAVTVEFKSLARDFITPSYVTPPSSKWLWEFILIIVGCVLLNSVIKAKAQNKYQTLATPK